MSIEAIWIVEAGKPLLHSIIEGSLRSFQKREDRYRNIS
jgi:hypothetical protein